ncbi:hypothetical protein V1506DRAFT_505941 [Lipomyces tetrasporus]
MDAIDSQKSNGSVANNRRLIAAQYNQPWSGDADEEESHHWDFSSREEKSNFALSLPNGAFRTVGHCYAAALTGYKTIVENGEYVGHDISANLHEVVLGDCIPTHLLSGQEWFEDVLKIEGVVVPAK